MPKGRVVQGLCNFHGRILRFHQIVPEKNLWVLFFGDCFTSWRFGLLFQFESSSVNLFLFLWPGKQVEVNFHQLETPQTRVFQLPKKRCYEFLCFPGMCLWETDGPVPHPFFWHLVDGGSQVSKVMIGSTPFLRHLFRLTNGSVVNKPIWIGDLTS